MALRRREIEYLVTVARLKPMLDQAMEHNRNGLLALIKARRDRRDVEVRVTKAHGKLDDEARLMVERSAQGYESAIESFRIAQRGWAKLSEFGGGDFEVMKRTIRRQVRAKRLKHEAFEEHDMLMSKYSR